MKNLKSLKTLANGKNVCLRFKAIFRLADGVIEKGNGMHRGRDGAIVGEMAIEWWLEMWTDSTL